MSYIGDLTPGKTVRKSFNTRQSNGSLVTLAGSPAAAVYRDAGTTESTAGVTLTVDFDARTGLHLVAVDTSADGTFYAAGHDFAIVLTVGTVAGTSVANTVLAEFSLANRSIAVDASGRVDVGYVGGVAATPDTSTDVILAGGTVATGTSATNFTATVAGSTLSPTTGAYDGMRLLFQSGALAGEVGVISTYVVASGTATFDFAAGQAFSAAPVAGSTFVIG